MDELPTPAPKREPTKDYGGTWMVIGDAQYKVPPLNFRSLRELTPKLAPLAKIPPGTPPTDEQLELIEEVIHVALKRNYPDLSREDLGNSLDMSNMLEALNLVMGVSGLVKKETAPGEVGATS